MNRIQIKPLPILRPEVIGRMVQPATVPAETNKSKAEMPALFMLNIDCFANILDYLSLIDLANVASTCKLLLKVAGYIFQLHYPFAHAIIDDDGMHLENHLEMKQYIYIFSEYIQCITFSNVMIDGTSQTQWHRFKSVKRVNFYYTRFNVNNFNLVKNILQNVETVELSDCSFGGNIFERFLDLCKYLKKLIITINYDYNASWLHQKYPRLEYVSIVPIVYIRREINEFTGFFNRNPNVRKFFTSSKFLLDNKSFIAQAKFDDLKISIDDLNFDTFNNIINELYANGVYKRFHVTFFECFKIDQPFIDQLLSIKALVGLTLPANIIDLDLNSFVNLEVLRFDCNISKIINMTQLAQNLTNLREISFKKASIEDILPFVYQLPKLRKIAVEKLIDFRRGINLLALNEKRKKLFEIAIHVSKVIIYIPETAYLLTRSRSITMSQKLVEIQRYDLYDFTPIQIMSW